MEKLHSYQGWGGRVHEWRDQIRERYANWREQHPETVIELIKKGARPSQSGDEYSHIYSVSANNVDSRRFEEKGKQLEIIRNFKASTKTRMELVKVSAAVMGIEFSYAAETAFVSPTLLSIGVQHQHMTLVWALSPLVGFFLTPILGSLSDRCRLNMGRRRPFIVLLSIGIFIGLLLVPNGEDIGYALGDFNPYAENETIVKSTNILAHRSTASQTETKIVPSTSHPWGVFFTIIGTVLLDFDADACQSPSRAYLLDVTLPEDHARGLSTFTVMAGLGGFMGYSLGGIDWDHTSFGILLGGHVRAVFTLVTVIFIACVSVTITSFAEVPLWKLESQPPKPHDFLNDDEGNVNRLVNDQATPSEPLNADKADTMAKTTSYGTLSNANEAPVELPRSNEKRRFTMPPLPTNPDYVALTGHNVTETSFVENANQSDNIRAGSEEAVASFAEYLTSIIFMPHSLRMVCLTNLFCWSAHVCYSLYFTDFVGESIFKGDPKAPEGSVEYALYTEGVRFGCWGMAMYSLSCACYSMIIERLIKQYGAKKTYIGGLLFYSVGMCLMALTRARASVIIFSWTAGVMYSTLFTMPYLLVAHYHSEGTFEVDVDGEAKLGTQVRGLGTDVAIVSSMVFLAQFILSICMGSIVTWSGTTTAVVSVASFLSFCGALSATQIMYLDL